MKMDTRKPRLREMMNSESKNSFESEDRDTLALGNLVIRE